MAIQTTFSNRHRKAVAGMFGSMVNYNTITRICEVAAGIGFGLGCAQGAGEKGVILQDATLTKFIGVSVKDPTVLPTTAGVTDVYLQYNEMTICTLGEIWAQVYENVTRNNAVFVDGVTGKFGTTDTANSIGPIVGARWVKDGTLADGIGLLSLGIQK